MLHLPGTKISPNPSKEYGLRQTDNVDFFSLGTLRTIGSCSLLPPPSQSRTKQTLSFMNQVLSQIHQCTCIIILKLCINVSQGHYH